MTDIGPVSFKKSRAKRTQRPREADSDVGTSEIASESTDDSPSTVAAKLKNKQKARIRPKSKLSFGVDEEEGDGEVFQVKKSNLSQKLSSRKLSSNVVASSYELPKLPQSNGPTYSQEYLASLKAATPTARPKFTDDESMNSIGDVVMDVDTVQPSNLAEVVDLTDAAAQQEAFIPSTSAIQAAKDKRSRLKNLGDTGEDYISLSVTKRDSRGQGPHPDSRLVREEDELGEGDDEFAEFTSAQERIALGKKSRKVEAMKRRDEMSELIAEAEEQDEETMEWEQEQLRRGGHIAEVQTTAPKAVYKATPIPPPTPIPTLEPAITRLTHSLTALTTSHSQHTASMVSLSEEQQQLEAREKEMREMIAKAEEKRSWFSSFREWIENVATFLDEKYPQLESLEEEQLSLLQERYDMISQRRLADDEDDLSLFLGFLPPAPEEQEGATDELGRVMPQSNVIARGERRSARTARHQKHLARNTNHKQEDDGFSTDSSLPSSDQEDYQLAIQKLSEKGKEILSDVRAKDFQDPKLGLAKWFGEWREKFSDTYTGAWGGLGMVGAWEFWVRLESLGWNPLEDTRTLDTFSWYTSLHTYSRPGRGEDEFDEPPLGPDGDLVSAMISTAILPRICKIVERGGLDPYSAKDIRRLIDLAEEIEISVAKDHAKFEMLFKAVFIVFQKAVTSTNSTLERYLTLNMPKFDPEAIPARRRFLSKRRKLLTNLLRWRRYTGERLGIGALATTLVERSMLPMSESGWEVGGEEVMTKVYDLLPPELVPSILRSRLK
ncbi:Intron Large complex component GCFC2-like protein [Abortiporus biennis]